MEHRALYTIPTSGPMPSFGLLIRYLENHGWFLLSDREGWQVWGRDYEETVIVIPPKCSSGERCWRYMAASIRKLAEIAGVADWDVYWEVIHT